MTTQYPMWSTPARRTKLVKLFVQSGGFCVYGHEHCLIPSHHYEIFIETVIDEWKQEDRYAWLEERKAMHSLGERRTPVTGRFNNISMDIFHDSQPLYYLDGYGMDGLTLQPFARVKLASSYAKLYISLGNSLKRTSKNQKRKAIRYGKALPLEVQERVTRLVESAVQDYLNH